ncbi:MAG: DNA repair protein RecN [Pyrinomonadaceae bacterium]
MLTLLKLKNIALIDELTIEFGDGLNLLTGETGSGKSIIVDSLGALIGDRISNDLIKQGEDSARMEGVFSVGKNALVDMLLDESGIDSDNAELIVRRELSLSGKNRVFINNQMVTQGFLQKLGAHLAEIHGQGEQDALYDVATHIAMLDGFAAIDDHLAAVEKAFAEWTTVRKAMASLEKDESEKLQLVDILRFQVNEIEKAAISPGEDAELEIEKRRLANAEKLTSLSGEVYSLLYESDDSTVSTLERASRKIAELGEYDPRFREYDDGLAAAQAVLQDVAVTARDFRGHVEFSPARLDDIENRLAEISNLKRKYGDSIESILEHLRVSTERLDHIETAELRENELRLELESRAAEYREKSVALHNKRVAAAAKFEKLVVADLRAVALEKARFEIRFAARDSFTPSGTDAVEFYFSANPGEAPRPLAKIASGGEASRLMLILKTAASRKLGDKTAVFDEIDIGIGGRVAEAVGRKLKALAAAQQVFCVTHQPQIASLADRHFVVEKKLKGQTTRVAVRELSKNERIDEIARMLAGEQITAAARENARSMLGGA